MIRKQAPISLTVYPPQTPEDRAELEKLTAELHAGAIIQQIKSLSCPTAQKQQLLDGIIHTVRETSRDRP